MTIFFCGLFCDIIKRYRFTQGFWEKFCICQTFSTSSDDHLDLCILLVKFEEVKITVPMQKPSVGCLVSDITDKIATESNQLVSVSPVSFFTPRMIKTVITQLTHRVIVVHVSTSTRPNNSYSNNFQLDVLFHCCSTNRCLRILQTMLEIGYTRRYESLVCCSRKIGYVSVLSKINFNVINPVCVYSF